MVKLGTPLNEPVPIGDVATPPFVRLPDPANVFAVRAKRLRHLAEDHGLKSYLSFLAGLCDAQHALQAGLARPDQPEAGALARAREFAMPPIDRGNSLSSDFFEVTLERFLPLVREIDMPGAAATALDHVREARPPERHDMARAILDQAVPTERIAEHVYVAAALQVHLARLAAVLDAASLVPVGDGLCPACGATPAASMIVGWLGAHGARYCGCSLCGTLWNHVRIKCALCGSTKGIAYKEIEGGPETVKAEACGNCHGYLKILHQHKDPAAEFIADDVASLALDLLMREAGFRRGGANPYLIGY